MTRHITVSTQEGMVTELELTGQGFGSGQTYMLRYHKTATASASSFEISVPEASSASWSGFRYRNNEVSVLLLRQGRSSAAA
jgi:hypothetical protein